MARTERGNGLVASLWGAVGVFLLGFFGAEALFAPGAEGLPLATTLVPAIVAAVAAFGYLMTQPLSGSEAPAEELTEPRQLHQRIEDPPAPAAGPHSHAA